MSEKYVTLSVRIPLDLHKRLADGAKREYRSLNGEIVRLLDIGSDPAKRHQSLYPRVGD